MRRIHLWSAILLLAVRTVGAQTFQGLGTLEDIPNWYAESAGISHDGATIVGRWLPNTDQSREWAFVWRPGAGMTRMVFPALSRTHAVGVSGDGATTLINGNALFYYVSSPAGTRWIGDLGTSGRAEAISADGLVVVGARNTSSSGIDLEAFRWTQATGIEGLGFEEAFGVSSDGSVIVGYLEFVDEGTHETPYVWRNGSGSTIVSTRYGRATAVSDDGTAVVGYYREGEDDAETYHAFREQGGMTILDSAPIYVFGPIAASGDGSVVVGEKIFPELGVDGHRAVMWTASHGLRAVQDVLEDDFGLDLTGWHLQRATDVSGDGRVITGYGRNSRGLREAWRAELAASDRIGGTVEYRDGSPAEGITLTLTGTSDEGEAVSETTTTDANGDYAFDDVPAGEYDVTASGEPPDENGGTLSADPEVGGRCPGDPTDATCHLYDLPPTPVSFIYTQCSATDRRPNGEPPTNCPIIFVPGFLGTRILCVNEDGDFEELWPNAPNVRFGEMTLAEDGYTNEGLSGPCSSSAFAATGRDGMVGEIDAGVTTIDVYQSTIDFLESIASDRWDAYAYDWRRAVPVSVPTVPVPESLDAAVDALLDDTGASRVVLMAHSMGGLVSRLYIDDADRADKVARFITLGTPYWGAPKTHFALLTGDSDQPGSAVVDLDLFVMGRDLQRFAQHAFGAFWLYPSANFGSWLSIGGVPRDAAGVNSWIAALGAAPALLDAAQAGHAQLDGFKTNDVDYAVVVGVGSATPDHINLRQEDVDFARIGQWADITYATGDSTVPARSATQGAIPTGTPLGEPVPIHYACRVGHVELPGNPGVTSRIEGFLVAGEPVEGPEDNCPYDGVQVRSFQVDLYQGTARVIVELAGARGVGAGAEELSVPEAAARGLIDVINIGDRSTIVINGHTSATLQFDGEHQALQVQTIASTGDGEWRSYPAGSEPVTIDVDGTVTSDGQVVQPVTVKTKPPRTKAKIKKKRGVISVKLKAKSRNGIAGTFYRIGEQGAVRYVEPFTLTSADLGQLSYASVDAFGTVEPWKRPRKK